MKSLVLISALTLAAGCYSMRQAAHFNNTYNSRRPIPEVLKDETIDQATRSRLEEVERIKAFAREEGLNTEGAYHYFIDIGGQAVSYIVQAAPQFELKLKTWWFMVIGDVPYLGFFSREERDEEAARLAAEGYDVAVANVGAFSSLGFFEDPVYSSMLRRSEGNLAQLFFHELTHRTFWSAGDATFNENLAEYVGLFLAQRYLRSLGKTEILKEFADERSDRKAFKEWLKALRGELETLYKAKGQLSSEDLKVGKKRIFESYLNEKRPAYKTRLYAGRREEDWNNAHVLAASLYSPDTERFEKAHACFGQEKTVGAFLAALKEAEDETEDAFKALDFLCSTKR